MRWIRMDVRASQAVNYLAHHALVSDPALRPVGSADAERVGVDIVRGPPPNLALPRGVCQQFVHFRHPAPVLPPSRLQLQRRTPRVARPRASHAGRALLAGGGRCFGRAGKEAHPARAAVDADLRICDARDALDCPRASVPAHQPCEPPKSPFLHAPISRAHCSRLRQRGTAVTFQAARLGRRRMHRGHPSILSVMFRPHSNHMRAKSISRMSRRTSRACTCRTPPCRRSAGIVPLRKLGTGRPGSSRIARRRMASLRCCPAGNVFPVRTVSASWRLYCTTIRPRRAAAWSTRAGRTRRSCRSRWS